MKKLLVLFWMAFQSFTTFGQHVDVAFYYAHHEYGTATSQTDRSLETYTPAAVPIIRSTAATQQHSYNLWSFRRFDFFKQMIALSNHEDVEISSFKIIRKTKRFDPFIGQNSGCHISQDILNEVKDAKKGDSFYIYDVTVKCQDGNHYSFPYTAIATIN